MSCYSADWLYVMLTLLCVIPHSSEVQVTYVACSLSLSETWEQTSLSMPSSAKKGHSRFISCPSKKIKCKHQYQLSGCLPTSSLAMNYGAEICMSFSKARAVMQDSTSLEELRSRKAFQDTYCHRFKRWYQGSAAPWSNVLGAGCKLRSPKILWNKS